MTKMRDDMADMAGTAGETERQSQPRQEHSPPYSHQDQADKHKKGDGELSSTLLKCHQNV